MPDGKKKTYLMWCTNHIFVCLSYCWLCLIPSDSAGPHRVNVTICVKYVGVTNVTPRLPIVVRHARSQSRLCFFHKCPNTNMILSYINVRLRNCLHNRTHQLNGKSTNEKGKTHTFNSFPDQNSLGNTTMFHNGKIGSAVLKTSKGPNFVLDFMISFFPNKRP